MIELYTDSTPNGWKVSVMLEEIELKYQCKHVDILKGEQKKEWFLKICPKGRIPAIIDKENNDLAIFESGAILLYLGEKTGKLLPQESRAKSQVVQWLMFQMGGVGPMFGQAHHFIHYAPDDIDYAIDRYTNEAGRLYKVLDNRLAVTEYVAGGYYSIADMACYPWIREPGRKNQKPSNFPNVQRWLKKIEERPAVRRGMAILSKERRDLSKSMDEETRKNLFGEAQYKRR